MRNSSKAMRHYKKINQNQNLGTKLWDNIIKDITLRMTKQLVPLINEVFKRNYLLDTEIILLNDKLPITRTASDANNNAFRYTDILLLINGTDLYHLECQINNDSHMAIRMVEYDFNVALRNSVKTKENGNLQIYFPHSTVIYPEWNKSIPNKLSCEIIFPDESTHDYTIDTVRIQDYTLDEIQQKHLNIFLPFQLLQFKNRLNSKRNRLSKNELKEFIEKIIIILDNELLTGFITKDEHSNYITYINQSAKRIFRKHSNLSKEVKKMTMPTIITPMSVMEEFKEELAEADAIITEQKNVIKKKENDLKEKEKNLKKKDDDLKKKDDTINNLKAEVELLKKQLSEKNNK